MTGPRLQLPQAASPGTPGLDTDILDLLDLLPHTRQCATDSRPPPAPGHLESGVNDLQKDATHQVPTGPLLSAGQCHGPCRLIPLPTLRDACLAVQSAPDYLIMQGPTMVFVHHLRPKTRPRSSSFIPFAITIASLSNSCLAMRQSHPRTACRVLPYERTRIEREPRSRELQLLPSAGKTVSHSVTES